MVLLMRTNYFKIRVNPDLETPAMVSPIYTITEDLKVKKEV